MKSSSYHTIETKSKGLSIALDNRVLEGYTKTKSFKMKHISRLFTLLIANKKNQLNSYLPFEVVAELLGLNLNVSTNRLKSDVRKVLRELYPTIEFREDAVKGVKFTHIPKGANDNNYIDKQETKGFTQLYCDLDFIKDKEVIVLFTVLEYFKGSAKKVYPSISTIMSSCGCGKRDKINKLLKEYQVTDETLGLWKIISSKGGSSKNTNRYELKESNH